MENINSTLSRKGRHLDELVVTGCAEWSCWQLPVQPVVTFSSMRRPFRFNELINAFLEWFCHYCVYNWTVDAVWYDEIIYYTYRVFVYPVHSYMSSLMSVYRFWQVESCSRFLWYCWREYGHVKLDWFTCVNLMMCFRQHLMNNGVHDDVIKWKHFLRYLPFVRRIHRWPVNSPHKGQWCGALIFSLISAWINGWMNNREAGDLRHHRACYDVTVMWF